MIKMKEELFVLKNRIGKEFKINEPTAIGCLNFICGFLDFDRKIIEDIVDKSFLEIKNIKTEKELMYKFIQVSENLGHNDVARTLLLTIVYVETLGYKDSMFYFTFPFLHVDGGNSIYICKANFVGYINYMVENKIFPKKLLSFDLEYLFNHMYYELDHSIDYKLLKTLCKYKLRKD